MASDLATTLNTSDLSDQKRSYIIGMHRDHWLWTTPTSDLLRRECYLQVSNPSKRRSFGGYRRGPPLCV